MPYERRNASYSTITYGATLPPLKRHLFRRIAWVIFIAALIAFGVTFAFAIGQYSQRLEETCAAKGGQLIWPRKGAAACIDKKAILK